MKRSLLVLLIMCFLQGHAQEEKNDPKIGLVLSGGGAKGLAHIGALKVLEEAGVQVDYIGGTSMGAVIGALYAAGYSAKQLDSIFEKTNFDLLIQDELPRDARTFYEKRDADKYVLTLPFDDFEISFPSGLSRGQNVYNFLSKLTLHLMENRDFKELPIPFFCIATDVETGEEVVLDSGHLPQAVLASSAIPTVFSPVKIDGRILTDGGVVNNFPVEEMRRRGADIVIGVDVQDSLKGREELSSVLEILTQISNMRTVKEMEGKREQTDVYINPPIGPYNVLSFDRGRRIIDDGEEAARKKITALEEIAQKQQKEKRPQVAFPVTDSLYIADVRIEGDHSYPEAYILGKIKLQYPSRVSYQDFIHGINNLSATGNFNRINYRLNPLNGGYVLNLQLEENPNKTFFRMSLHYDDLYKSAALVNITKKSSFFTNDVTSFDLILGDNLRYNFDYYWDKGHYWSVGLRSRYNRFDKNVNIGFAEKHLDLENLNINRLAIDYSDLTNQIYVETLFEQGFSLGLGAEHKYLQVDSETIADVETPFPATVFDRSNYYSGFGYLKYDSYDDKYLPKKGMYFNGDFHLYFMSSDYNENFSEFSVLKATIGYAFTPIDRFSVRLSAGAGLQIGKNENNSFDFFLGGYGNDFINNIVPFYGYDFLELSGDSHIRGLLDLDYEIFRKNHLIVGANFGSVGDNLFSGDEWILFPEYSGYALGYAIESFMGPLEVKYTYSPETGNSHWFFSLGFWF